MAVLIDSDVVERIQPNNGHIVAIVPRGEVLRNFEYSGTFENLAKNAKLSLLTISPTSKPRTQLDVKYQGVFPLNELGERWLVRFQREILDIRARPLASIRSRAKALAA